MKTSLFVAAAWLLGLLAPARAQHWEPVPMVRQDILDAGFSPGGEGGQFPEMIVVDGLDGQVILFGTDVGGVFRSEDGGRHFTPANLGFSATGACGFAIDPRNPARVLAVGDNASHPYYEYGGVYRSTDRGASWTQVFPRSNNSGGRDRGREQIAFDPASFDAAFGGCRVAYWVEEYSAAEPGGKCFKSTDGGVTWARAAKHPAYEGGDGGGSILKVLPTRGWVFIANDKGLFRSTDGGTTFQKIVAEPMLSLDTVASAPTGVWASTGRELLRSDDGGDTFARLPVPAAVARLSRVKVSPADPRRLIARDEQGGARHHSEDGGQTWAASAFDGRLSFFPAEILYNDRNQILAWHPRHAQEAWAFGPGDIITRTTDGGASFHWANNGNNGIMTGGLMNFSVTDPDVLYFGSQDYNGAVTRDAGRTWEFVNLSRDNHHARRGDDGDPWGWVYGGYGTDGGRLLFGGNRAYGEDDYNLWLSDDGGKTTREAARGLHGAQVSYQDPARPDVLFCWDHRSADGGRTWARMAGCDGVFIASAGTGRFLVGRDGRKLVRSADGGATWQPVAELPADVADAGYDHAKDCYYVACDKKVFILAGPVYRPESINDRLPRDQHGDAFAASTVAVDPVRPAVVYAGACGTGLFFQRNNAVARSLDAGATWERLTCNPKFGPDGGQMASALRVHPVSRYLYVGTCCYGTWRIGPPPGQP